MIYSLWRSRHGATITLVEGGSPPVFADGTLQDPGAVKIHEYEAKDVDEAIRLRGLLMGWVNPER